MQSIDVTTPSLILAAQTIDPRDTEIARLRAMVAERDAEIVTLRSALRAAESAAQQLRGQRITRASFSSEF